LRNVGVQYPWTWSAGVLLALFGLSIWVLNHSIKSLDRLK
jgi:ABC-2 type transport system permease protein